MHGRLITFVENYSDTIITNYKKQQNYVKLATGYETSLKRYSQYMLRMKRYYMCNNETRYLFKQF